MGLLVLLVGTSLSPYCNKLRKIVAVGTEGFLKVRQLRGARDLSAATRRAENRAVLGSNAGLQQAH